MIDTPAVLAPIEIAAYRELMGRAAMALRTRPRLIIHIGGVRRWGDRSARPPALNLKIVQKEPN